MHVMNINHLLLINLLILSWLLLILYFTSQLAAVQLEAVERVGAEQKNMFLWMDWLQLFKSGLPTADRLHTHFFVWNHCCSDILAGP